jgi:hypothetical protein
MMIRLRTVSLYIFGELLSIKVGLNCILNYGTSTWHFGVLKALLPIGFPQASQDSAKSNMGMAIVNL